MKHTVHKSWQTYKTLRRLIVVLFLMTGLAAYAQEGGSVTGVVVSSWDGTPMPSVVVSVKGTTLAAQTDASGRYQLNNVPPGDQTVRFSKSGFAAAVVSEVRVLTGQTTTVNGNLRPEFYEMEEYEVTAEEFAEQSEKILIERQQASSLMDAIGSEQFSRLGAGDAGQIVSRVTGVSVVGGKYAVVRGLSDRYTRTLLNGVEVPSADPYRMSPQLDLFPSAMIDRISISKTFTPDQPGGTGGGLIDIITKSFPEKPFVKLSMGTSYNPDSNFKKDFLADPDSSMKMFALPSGPKPLNPALFGLIEAPQPPGPASSRETPQRAESRRQAADDVAGLLQELGTANFSGVPRESLLNSSFNASAGQTVSLFDRNFGMFGGINYSRNFRSLEDIVVNKIVIGSPERLGREDRGTINTDYGANVNLGYDLSEYARLGFNFMLAHSIEEDARHGTYGFVEGRDDTLERFQLHFTDREIVNYEVSGHHELPFLADSKVDWIVGLANTTQNEPDHRFMNFFVTPGGQPQFGDSALPAPNLPSRFFREVEEHSLNSRVDWTLPLSFFPEDSNIKAGFFNSATERDYREQFFTYNLSEGFDIQHPNTYLDQMAYLDYVATHPGGIRTNYNFQRYVEEAVANPYTGTLDVMATYAMADLGVFSWLRLIGGARIERTLMQIDASSRSSSIDQTDLLPAASAVITLWTNLNLRLSYGETVARPSFREKAFVSGFDNELGFQFVGNPDLQMTAIKSYDARLEWFPAPGDILSIGFFYKELELPIEKVARSLDAEQFTWDNRTNGAATVMGVEFEARKSLEFLTPLFKGLVLGANVTLIHSETELTDNEYRLKTDVDGDGIIDFPAERKRPLYDQSPYIINLDLSYDHPTSGTSFTIAANLTGERIALVYPTGEDVYEHPPITLDAAISQRFGKVWTARVGVRNLLDPEYRQTYGKSYNGDIFQSYKRGRTFTLSVSAEF